jgi:hypothetical protein
LGGGRAAGRRSSGAPSSAGYQHGLAPAPRQGTYSQRAGEAERASAAFAHILNLHRVEFPLASRPIVPSADRPSRLSIYQRFERQELAGVAWFRWDARAKARRRAQALTDAEVQRLVILAAEQQAQLQQSLDERWQQLLANVPDVVIETLEEAFEDNEVPSAAVGVTGDEVSLVVLVPPAERVVPERMPTRTEAGNLSLKKLLQRERADYYKLFVCGQVLVTVREALAVAPKIRSASVAVLRNEGDDAYGKPRVSCLLAAKFDRPALDGVQWASANAATIVNDVATESVSNQSGRSREFAPINLADEPALAQLIEAVDVEELTAAGSA